ncbi:MAG: tRNA 4-thiouridine(8) synthase ThiI [bacterium]
MTKALVLLSGGLDSMLAARVLIEQGVEVTGLSFKSNFFGAVKAKKAAEQLDIKFIEVDFSSEHLKMLKNPAHGYGKNMNPCIDCHGLMLKKAKEIMEKENFDFVATGEVLGQRPMSQHRDALDIVEKISGLEGKLVRPLSAKLLNESEPEKKGKLIRGKLLDISGRSRQRQLELVKKYGIKEYASPGGGCLLTDPEFSEKLLKLLEYWPDCVGGDIELLKHGRVFWLKDENGKNVLLIIGREQKDNEQLEKLAKTNDVLINPVDENGPTSLIRGIKYKALDIAEREILVTEELKMSELKLGEPKNQEEIITLGLVLTGYYATKSRGKKIKLNIINN